MKKKTLMRGLAGMLAAGMLCLMPVTSYVNAAEQGYVQTTERSAEFYGVNAEAQDLDITTNETDSLETADTGKHASGGSDADKARRVNRIKCRRSQSGQIMRMKYRMRTFRTGTLI